MPVSENDIQVLKMEVEGLNQRVRRLEDELTFSPPRRKSPKEKGEEPLTEHPAQPGLF